MYIVKRDIINYVREDIYMIRFILLKGFIRHRQKEIEAALVVVTAATAATAAAAVEAAATEAAAAVVEARK